MTGRINAVVFTKEQDRLEHIHGSWTAGWKCPDCGKHIHGKKKNYLHAQGHKITGKGHFPCPKCGEIFNWRKDLNKHNNTQHPKAQLRCQSCGNRFLSEARLSEPDCIHRNLQYHCLGSEKSYHSSQDLQMRAASQHSNDGQSEAGNCSHPPPMAHRDSDAGYRCSACGKECASAADLIVHLLTHSDKPFKCAICAERYSSKRDLRRHYHCHFECSICGVSFVTKQALDRHLSKRHKVSGVYFEDKRFQCAICKKHYSSKRVLTKHYLSHYKCPLCPRIFETKSILDSHVAEHHKCHFCAMIFKTEAMLDSHVAREHEGLSSYECILCLGSFLGERALDDHMRDVHGNNILPIIE